MLQAGLHLLPLSGIEHQRNFDVRHQTRGEFVHVSFAVAADKIHVDVEDVRAFTLLLFRQRDQAVPVFGVQQIAHFL